jgi:molybdopterin/thiamine biosynthesis adenylyltransferase
MRYHLRIGGDTLADAVIRLESNSVSTLRLPMGSSRLDDSVEYLVRGTPGESASAAPGVPAIAIVGATLLSELNRRMSDALSAAPPPTVVLGLGLGVSRGYVAAIHDVLGRGESLDRIAVVGPGCPSVVLGPGAAADSEEAVAEQPRDHERHSRSVRALGFSTWRRLTTLRMVLVGAGRTGSLAAKSLVRLGCNHLSLIDADTVEMHNLGEMDAVGPEDVGRSKVEAVASALQRHPRQVVFPVPASVLSPSGLVAAKQADLVLSTADRGSARLGAAVLAALYLRPLLDIGTGIFGGGTDRRMGGDVRLVLPGRCLVCFGGIADLAEVAREMVHPLDVENAAGPDAWRLERAGSLRSLNHVAVGLALRLHEDFVDLRVRSSTWLHFEIDANGVPTIEHRRPAAIPDCPLCRLAGAGDGGLGDAVTVLDRTAAGKTSP